MKIELRPLAEIKPYEKNPRINDAAVDAVAESIRRFGHFVGVGQTLLHAGIEQPGQLVLAESER